MKRSIAVFAPRFARKRRRFLMRRFERKREQIFKLFEPRRLDRPWALLSLQHRHPRRVQRRAFGAICPTK